MKLQIKMLTRDDGQPLPFPAHSYWVDPALADEAARAAAREASLKDRRLTDPLALESAQLSPDHADLVELVFAAQTEPI